MYFRVTTLEQYRQAAGIVNVYVLKFAQQDFAALAADVVRESKLRMQELIKTANAFNLSDILGK